MPDPITLLIVDDHEVVRKGVRGYLDTLPEIEVVGEAQSGEEAVELAQKYIPDVILMDLVLPGIDGVESTRIIKNISPRTQIVVLTSYHDDALIFPALKAGAISYILKDMKMDKLAEAVRKAHRGEVILHPKVAARVLQNLRRDSQNDEEVYTELTEREMDVLKLIANGYSNNQIAEELVISENTVKGHVSNILSKLHLADRTQAAVYAWKQGIVKRESMD
jgi:NarL family two-component system response regulator LiaR